MIQRNFKTAEEFKEWVPIFWGDGEKPFAYVVCEAYYDQKGNFVSVKALTVNIQKYFGFAAAVFDFNGHTKNHGVIYQMIVRAKDSETFMKKYFRGFKKNEKGHYGLNVMREIGIKKGKDIIVVFYPTVECLKAPPADLIDGVCKSVILIQLQEPEYLATFGE